MRFEAVLRAALVALAIGVSLVPYLAFVGLAVHRHAPPVVTAVAATLLVYFPALVAAVLVARSRATVLATVLASWSMVLFLVFPVYFPGERRAAVATGLGMIGVASDGLPQQLAGRLPEEPVMARPEVAEAAPLKVPLPPPPGPLGEHQIALPFEGEGRRLSIPVIFGHGTQEIELDMMFDTGATYTTLSRKTLDRLGRSPRSSDPVIRLHTANGERDAQVLLIDRVWLGDLVIEGVAIAVCDDCAGMGIGGLLGLNIAGGFNVNIDADRKEVIFARRATFDRRLDVKPFSDLTATFTRFRGGRVEAAVALENRAERPISAATASVKCADKQWTIELPAIAHGTRQEAQRRLPVHDACEQYEIALHYASW